MTTRHGIRLWTVKQAPYFDSGRGWAYDFDPGDIVFTPKMAKRAAPGPFAATPIIQGNWDGTGDGDVLTYSRGAQLSGNFYANMDTNQGSVVGWWTPERTRHGGNSYEYLWRGSSTYWIRYYHLSHLFYVRMGNQTTSTSFYTVAGAFYFIAVRWDCDNTLDGTNYICISIDDTHAFSISSPPTASAPLASPIMGSNDGKNICNGMTEGWTIYRRPLFDGTYGIDAGNGDELNLMWAAGAGKDPCLVTGSWDVCFCLPTNSSTGEIVTGEGEAWSHPHGSNLLGVGGFMMNGTYVDDGWNEEGTPTAVAALATAEKIFNGGYKVTSDAANEGIYKDYTCSAGDDFVIRVLAHSDGTSVPKAILYDQTNTAEIGSLTGSNASTRTAPDAFIFTGEAPAGCTTLRVKLINTDATAADITYWHQCELLDNLITNPSLETGSGDPWIPTGYQNLNLAAGDTELETTIVHSGAGCIKLNATASSSEYPRRPAYLSDYIGRFISGGAWIYGNGDFGWRNERGRLHSSSWAEFRLYSADIASWQHKAGVGRIDSSPWYQIYGKGNVHYVDDVYCFFVDDVSLTVTPANETNCQESGGIRIVGRATGIKDITGILGRTSGRVRFKWKPRHGDGVFEKFGNTNPRIVQLYKDSTNLIMLRSDSNENIYLYINVGGAGLESYSWNALGITAGSTYLIEIQYSAILITVSFNGVVRHTIAYSGGIDWGANIPDTIHFGVDENGERQHDAVFIAP